MEICNIDGGIVLYCDRLLMTPYFDSHSTTDVCIYMITIVSFFSKPGRTSLLAECHQTFVLYGFSHAHFQSKLPVVFALTVGAAAQLLP